MTALTKVEKLTPCVTHFDEAQVELIKNSICKGASNEELQFFLMACQRTGLDPFARQIYSVPRAGQRTIQTSVDGFRLIADRSGKYAPGREPTFEYDKNGHLLSATAYVKKQTKDGSWHEVSANAYFDEYNANSPIWKKMPRAMLSKCAECLALRKAFPAEMSGIYGQEEMEQADSPKHEHVKPLDIQPDYKTKVSLEQAIELQEILNQCSDESKKKFLKTFNISCVEELPVFHYQNVKGRLIASREEHQKWKKEQEILLEKEMAITGDVEVMG